LPLPTYGKIFKEKFNFGNKQVLSYAHYRNCIGDSVDCVFGVESGAGGFVCGG
jgi:hypothetical protein